MKRRVLILVTILLAISALAHAETFQLHSGVQFGMSMDEVMKREVDAGYNVWENKNSYYLDEIGDINCLRLSAPNLAGLGGAIEYQFDTNNQQLNLCIYSLDHDSLPSSQHPLELTFSSRWMLFADSHVLTALRLNTGLSPVSSSARQKSV